MEKSRKLRRKGEKSRSFPLSERYFFQQRKMLMRKGKILFFQQAEK